MNVTIRGVFLENNWLYFANYIEIECNFGLIAWNISHKEWTVRRPLSPVALATEPERIVKSCNLALYCYSTVLLLLLLLPVCSLAAENARLCLSQETIQGDLVQTPADLSIKCAARNPSNSFHDDVFGHCRNSVLWYMGVNSVPQGLKWFLYAKV